MERAQKMQILQDLAWRLSLTGRSELPKAAVAGWTGGKLAAMSSAPAHAEAVVEYLLLGITKIDLTKAPAS